VYWSKILLQVTRWSVRPSFSLILLQVTRWRARPSFSLIQDGETDCAVGGGMKTQQCAAETAQQREARLARRRLRDRARRTAQSTAEVRFQQKRLASEAQEHRAVGTIRGRGWPLRHRRREQLVCCRLWLSPTKYSTMPPVCVAPSITS